jgi:hypothetical protein
LKMRVSRLSDSFMIDRRFAVKLFFT